MAAPPGLRRLLRVLELEEEQAQRALETAKAAVRSLERALVAAGQREHRGLALVRTGVENGSLIDRLAGAEEWRLGRSAASNLRVRTAEAEQTVAATRQEYLAKRVERRQAESLIRDAQARQAAASGRRSQQHVDDWYLERRWRDTAERPAGGCLDGGELEAKSGEQFPQFPNRTRRSDS